MALHEFNYEKEKVIDIVKKILEDAILIYATDIHFDPTEEELIIKLRIDGDLIEYTTVPNQVMKHIITRLKILSGMNITETSIPQTGIINYKIKSKAYNMRVSSIPVLHGEKIVVHISNHSTTLVNLDDLNFSEKDLKKIKNLLNNPSGTVLLAGSSTSGMATTLYAMTKEIDYIKKSVITIEDHIKINLDGINQVQINRKKGLTPTKILNNVLLTDPNIIILNEINDIETAVSVLKASSTGRLLISTIHSKNVYTTIDTLINMDIENYLLSSSLTGIISQRLVKKICPKCRKLRKTNEFEKQLFTKVLSKNVKEIYEPVGCDNCINGYQGQVPLAEVLELTDSIKNAITNPKEKDKIRTLVYENMTPIFEDGLRKVINGQTSIDEVIRVLDLNSDFDESDDVIKELILEHLESIEVNEEPINADVTINSLIADKLPIDIEIENVVPNEIEGISEIIENKDNKDIKENNEKNKIDDNKQIDISDTKTDDQEEKNDGNEQSSQIINTMTGKEAKEKNEKIEKENEENKVDKDTKKLEKEKDSIEKNSKNLEQDEKVTSEEEVVKDTNNDDTDKNIEPEKQDEKVTSKEEVVKDTNNDDTDKNIEPEKQNEKVTSKEEVAKDTNNDVPNKNVEPEKQDENVSSKDVKNQEQEKVNEIIDNEVTKENIINEDNKENDDNEDDDQIIQDDKENVDDDNIALNDETEVSKENSEVSNDIKAENNVQASNNEEQETKENDKIETDTKNDSNINLEQASNELKVNAQIQEANVSTDNKTKDIANNGLSMDQDEINKIKSNINYDDFSYDDSYNEEF